MMLSLARSQNSLFDYNIKHPLFPVLISGCPISSNDHVQYPLEIGYDYSKVDASIFSTKASSLNHWQQLLPPIDQAYSLGEGNTPLLKASRLKAQYALPNDLFFKIESANPTWSHKDRYNFCVMNAAVKSNAKGIVVASSGNHGASAAAYAARAGLHCTVIVSDDCPLHILKFISAYGAEIVKVPHDLRWLTLRQYVLEKGYHPASNYTNIPTGHPFGVEGYKTIAYELFQQLNFSAPGAVLIPTGYGELFFGIWKGFNELKTLGLIDAMPYMVSCEPMGGGPLHKAYISGEFPIFLEAFSTKAYAIACRKTGYRGLYVLKNALSQSLLVLDDDMLEAQKLLGSEGVWSELSSASSVAALKYLDLTQISPEKPVVSIITSSGFKDI